MKSKNLILYSPDKNGQDSSWLDDALDTFGTSPAKSVKTQRPKPKKAIPDPAVMNHITEPDESSASITKSVSTEEFSLIEPKTVEPAAILPDKTDGDVNMPINSNDTPDMVEPAISPINSTDETSAASFSNSEQVNIDVMAALMNEEINDSVPPSKHVFSDRHDRIKVIVFAAVMLFMFTLGLLIPLRPTISEVEKRTLTAFPKLEWNSFKSGDYFSQIEKWYSDTFPLRDTWISLNSSLQSMYGFGSEIISGGGKGDDIPTDTIDIDSYLDSISSDTDPHESSETHDKGDGGEIIESLYVKGDTAFELYYFNQANATLYAKLIADAATQLGDDVQVYDMIVPLSYSVLLDKKTQDSIHASDANGAISYMYSTMKRLNQNIKTIDILGTLQNHSSEYLYFRTDHHWTALGAYYAYEEFTKVSGIPTTPLASYTNTRRLDGFLGTLHASLAGSNAKMAAKLEANPDYVLAYVPMGTNDNHITLPDGSTLDSYGVVNRVSNGGPAAKYQAFLGGDFPLCEIHNPKITNGSSIVVVKESFGNAFVPFLVDNYEYVYVIDYRYYNGSLNDFVTEHNVKDVLFINYIFATGSSSAQKKISNLLAP